MGKGRKKRISQNVRSTKLDLDLRSSSPSHSTASFLCDIEHQILGGGIKWVRPAGRSVCLVTGVPELLKSYYRQALWDDLDVGEGLGAGERF